MITTCIEQKKSSKKCIIIWLNQYKVDPIFMVSGNSKASYPHRLILSFTDKINLRRNDKCVALSNVSIY